MRRGNPALHIRDMGISSFRRKEGEYNHRCRSIDGRGHTVQHVRQPFNIGHETSMVKKNHASPAPLFTTIGKPANRPAFHGVWAIERKKSRCSE